MFESKNVHNKLLCSFESVLYGGLSLQIIHAEK